MGGALGRFNKYYFLSRTLTVFAKDWYKCSSVLWLFWFDGLGAMVIGQLV